MRRAGRCAADRRGIRRREAARELAHRSDVITYEFENVDADVAAMLMKRNRTCRRAASCSIRRSIVCARSGRSRRQACRWRRMRRFAALDELREAASTLRIAVRAEDGDRRLRRQRPVGASAAKIEIDAGVREAEPSGHRAGAGEVHPFRQGNIRHRGAKPVTARSALSRRRKIFMSIIFCICRSCRPASTRSCQREAEGWRCASPRRSASSD